MTGHNHHATLHRHPELGIAALELASGRSFPRHAHDEFGIGVMLSGAQRSWSGVGLVESVPGDVITVNPGELHDGEPIGGDMRCWRIIYFEPESLVAQLAPLCLSGLEFQSPCFRDPRLGPWVNRLFGHLATAAEPIAIEETLAILLPQLAASSNRHGRNAGKAYTFRTSPSITIAKARIEDDPASPISLAELASLERIDRYQFVRAFARDVGTTPHAYLMQCRVRLVRRLLGKGETLASAAHLAGFADQSHMTRAFGRQFGISPGRYRAAGRWPAPPPDAGPGTDMCLIPEHAIIRSAAWTRG